MTLSIWNVRQHYLQTSKNPNFCILVHVAIHASYIKETNMHSLTIS